MRRERRDNMLLENDDSDEEEIDTTFLLAADLPPLSTTPRGNFPIIVALLSDGLRASDFEEQEQLSFSKLYAWDRVLEVKKSISSLEIPMWCQVLFYQGKELCNEQTLSECGFSPDVVTVLDLCDSRVNVSVLSVFGRTSTGVSTMGLVNACNAGFKMELAPRLSDEGTGATYFLHNEHGDQIACFKPGDEEQNAFNNPRVHPENIISGGLTDTMSRIGRLFTPGEQHFREIAAYLLDEAPHMLPQYQHFHDVPKTTRCVISDKYQDVLKHFHYKDNYSQKLAAKVGSLQEFTVSDGEVTDDNEASIFPTFEVHKIGILDIRLLNCDRTANILLVRDSNSRIPKLVPIDHGLCLPSHMEIGWCDWAWMTWPQAKTPFDPFTLKFIEAIDIEKDIARIQDELPIDKECLRSMKVSCLVLKAGAKHGLNLHDIATIITRKDLDQPSALELLCVQADFIARGQRRTWKQVSPNCSVETRAGTNEQTSSPLSAVKDSYVEGVKFLGSNDTKEWKRTQSCLGFFEDQLNMIGGFGTSKPTPISVYPTRVVNPSEYRTENPGASAVMPRPSLSSSNNEVNELSTQRSLNDSQVVLEQNEANFNSTDLDERFFHYIEKLVEIQCMNFRKSQVSNEPDLYDNETMQGTFNGLQSLEKHRSRFHKENTQDYGALMTRMLSTPSILFDLDYTSDHEEDAFDDDDDQGFGFDSPFIEIDDLQ